MFVRFVVGANGEDHRRLTGVVAEARFLLDDGLLSAEEEARLAASYDWLNSHLPVPPFSTSSWPDDVSAWFKHTAHEPIRCMRDLAGLLEDHGQPVRMLRSRNPGRVVYEDEFQVVVAEYKRL